MSNRRVKSLAYDDDYDDYEEDEYAAAAEEISEDDQEQLRLGTLEVQAALGASLAVTDDEVKESLWYYYFDVGKTVKYLKDKHSSAAPKGKRTNKAQDGLTAIAAGQPKCLIPVSAKDFFKDSPWLKVPEHRKADILIEPLYPHLGLLGGASNGKMSKLAALAAKRRQKENPKPSKPNEQPSALEPAQPERLDSLHLSPPGIPAKPAKELPLGGNSFDSKRLPKTTALQPSSKSESQFGDNSSNNTWSLPAAADLRARPSAFASTMLGSSNKDLDPQRQFPISESETDSTLFDFTEPSPDDVVTKAQTSKATTNKPKPKDPPNTKKTVSIAIDSLSLQEPVNIRSKNLDVVTEYKKIKRKNAANFVVIGHVDAGKSTLMGRLLFDLKAIDERTMERYKKEAEAIGKGSFAFAWVLDQGSEERARGVTIDIATNKFETEKTSFTILDAPGHRDFVPNMIAGASQADFAVLVIDASTGNFESGLKGQTKEHALLVRSIGVQRVIVAINKMDMADWSQDRFQEIRQQMSGFLTTAGFQAKNVSFVPCSGLEGANILNKTEDARASWYTGKTLVEHLDESEPTTHALDKPLRMTIADVFRGGVQNPLSVSGRLEAGNVQMGEQVVIMPSSEKALIKSLEVDDEPREWAVAGENVVLHLTVLDIDAINLKTGDVLCSTSSPIKNVQRFQAKVLAFEHLTPMMLDVHRGRLHVPARISQLIATLDKASGLVVKKKPKIVQPGSVVRVMVDLEQPVPLEAPGRLVLRANGETVAAGLIESS